MQVSQKAGLKWQLAICPPRASFAEHQPKRKWYHLCGLLYFVAFVTTEFFTQSEARAFHSWREGWETLTSSVSIFSMGGLKESSFTFLCSLAPCYRECQTISERAQLRRYLGYWLIVMTISPLSLLGPKKWASAFWWIANKTFKPTPIPQFTNLKWRINIFNIYHFPLYTVGLKVWAFLIQITAHQGN